MIQKDRLFTYFISGFSFLVLALALVARVRLLAIPLERDEGAFASIGHAMWQGAQLYTTLFDNKPPLLYAIYGSFTHLFGYSPMGVHLGLLIFHLATCFFLYLFVNQYYDKRIALLSVAFFSIFALLPNVFGFAAHATQLLLLPAIAGLWLLNRKPDNLPSIFLAGVLLSASFLIKQQAVGIIAGAIILFLWESYERKKDGFRRVITTGLLFAAGLILPIALMLAWFLSQGRLDDLWHWTVDIPGQLLEVGSASTGVFETYILPYFHGFELAIGLAFLGVIVQSANAQTRRPMIPFVLLFLLALATTFLGAAFYPHYFVLALPFFAALCASGACAFHHLIKTGGQPIAVLAILLAIGYPVAIKSAYFFQPDFKKIHRQSYGLNPFPEMEEIGKTLGKQAKPGEILILGSEPEALVAAGQIPPTGYPFILDDRMPGSKEFQQATSDYLKNKKPKFVIFVPTASSWYSGYQQSTFVRDLQSQLQQNYLLTGTAQIDKKYSKILWNEEARKPPEDPSKIGALIFRRKE